MSHQNNSPIKGLTPSEARQILWKQGKVTDFLLDSNQKFVRDQIRQHKRRTHVIVFSRQVGKSFGLLGWAVEELINRKNIVICYVAPRLKQGKEIVKQTFNEMFVDCPDEIRPKFDRDSSSYIFPSTNSRLQLYGFNAEEIESARGPKAHGIIIDECGFMNDLKYGIRSVLRPKLNTTKGPMILISTLPKSQGHEYYEFIKKAEYDGTLLKRNVFDCPRYTKEDIDVFAEEVGGYDSVDFKREYLNIMITDEDHAVIPEATDDKLELIVKDVPRPPYYDCYVSMDIGGKDFTAIIFAYYDFLKGKIVIEAEESFRGKKFTTNNIADSVKSIENELWGIKKPFLRIADNNNLILLNDLQLDHGLTFHPTSKDNKIAWINQVRVMVADERIIINPRCKQLIFHLKNATWNKKKSDYERSLDGGHYDFVDALAYLIRNISFSKNPYPAGYGMLTGDGYFNGDGKPRNSFENHLINMFSFKNRN